MSGPLQRVADVQEYVPQADAQGEAYPWAKPLLALQGRLRDVVRKLASMPWTTGRTVTVNGIAAGVQFSVAHGLGRIPVRWTVEDVTGGATNYGLFRRTAWDATTVTFIPAYASTSCTFRFE